jgi:hypothetical protein
MRAHLAKVGVEGSSLFARSRFSWYLNYFRWAARGGLVVFDPGGASGGAASRPGGDDARSLCFLLFEFLCRKNAAVTKRSQFLKGSRLQGELQALLAHAQHQTAMIRRSIADRTGHSFDGGGPDGNLLTVAMVRENSADPQTVMQALADNLIAAHKINRACFASASTWNPDVRKSRR